MAEKLLLVEDEDTLRESLKRVFLRDGYEVEVAESAEAALKVLEERTYDIIITDILLPGISGIELLKKYREQNAEQIFIVMTAFASLETAVDALRGGAHDYIIKPIIHEEIRRIVRNALKERALQSENMILKKQIEERYDFENIVGQSSDFIALLQELKKISDSKSNVLLLGETGTGKELFARFIHHSSPRRNEPFVPINCSAIPEHLLESELFGYLKGSFTGASSSKRGLFEEADRGTVFLDEIGELSMPLQSKLLRVIDDREIRPIGSVQSRRVDIRYISATNSDLNKALKEGLFREDLFYRINVVTLKLPPLRDRRDDILLLARHFLSKYSMELGRPVKHMDETAQKILLEYDWPGNVRELQNIIERAILIAEGDIITSEHLHEGLKPSSTFLSDSIEKALSIEEYTKAFILNYQKKFNEQTLANMLGITRKSLWEKRKRWDIARKQM